MYLSSIGTLLFDVSAMWSASHGTEAVINGLNAVFDVGEYHSWWRRTLAIVMTVVLAGAILAALVFVI